MSGTEIDLTNLSDNPEDLAAAFAQLESGGDPSIKEPEPKSEAVEADKTEKAEEAPDEKGKQEAESGQSGLEDDAIGVATKLGKQVIPYSVLKNERERASRAESALNEMKERVSLLESMVKTGIEGAKPGESARADQNQSQASDMSDEDLESLKEDFPTVYRALKAATARAEALEAKLAPVEESVRSSETERAQSAADTVQEAIDSVPKLAHIQAADADAFDMAKTFDAALRARPEWADRPLSERFAKVTEMVEAALGPIEIPGATKNTATKTGDLKAAAKAKAAQATKTTRSDVPTSLSEFPAGQHAAQDEREEAETLSHLQLAEKFSSMSPDQMDAYFRTL